MDVVFCGVSENELLIKDFMQAKLQSMGIVVSFTTVETIDAVLDCDKVYDFYILDTAYRTLSESVLMEKIKRFNGRLSGTVAGFLIYLQKKINIDELTTAFKQMDSYIKQKNSRFTFEFLAENGLQHIEVREILYFEYTNRKVIVKTKQTDYIIVQKISDVFQMFKEHHFVMPHKSFVINLAQVSRVCGSEIVMMDKSVIPLSQKRAKEIRSQYKTYCDRLKNSIS